MSERSRRSAKSNWRARERKLRAKYRGKIAIAVIVSLIVGMIGGIVVDKLVLTKHADTTVTPTAQNTEAPSDVVESPNLFGNPTEAVMPEAEATQAPILEVDTPDTDAEVEVEEEVDFIEVLNEDPEEIDLADAEWDETLAAAEEETDFIEKAGEETTIEELAEVSEEEVIEESAEETEEKVEPAPTLAIGLEAEEAELEQKEEETEPEVEAAEDTSAEETEVEPEEETEEVPADPDAVAAETEEEPTAEEATEEPEVTATPAPEKDVTIVRYGDAYTLTTDINSDGTAHTQDDGTDFENVSMTLQVKKYLDFDYYDRTYGSKYNLKGGTAAVVLGVTLNGYTGTAPIIPQNFLLITFCDETGEVTTQGVQIIDAEISGNVGVMVTSDVPATVYKRYYKEDAGKEMTYMVVTTYNNGVKSEYWFEIIIPPEMITPAPTADPNLATLTIGSRGDEVIKLQQTLIDAGYLEGTADGVFGSMTAEGVKLMQKQMGMEETGEADPLFLTYLYMNND